MSSRVVLNIGWARSASTAFRQNFLTQHPEIHVCGRDQPILDGPGARILKNLKSMDAPTFLSNSAELGSAWADYARRQSKPVICLSDEEMSIGLLNTGVQPKEIATRCALLFPGASTLAIVRDQVDAIRSFYGLATRQGGTAELSLSDWTRTYFIEPKGRGFSYLFDYLATLRSYLEWQPRRDLTVLAYDGLKTRHASFYSEAANALGISEDAARQLPNEIVNASQSVPFSASPEAGTADDGNKNRMEYSPGLEVKIRTLYESCNRGLAHEFGIEFVPAISSTARRRQGQHA